jgi:hypothetical protein
VDLPRVYRRLARSRARSHWFARVVSPAIYVLGAVRKGKLWDLLHWACSVLLRRPGYGIVNVGISNYRGAMFLDEQRIERCASAFYTSVGPVKSCLHFLGCQDLPGSRQNEQMDLGCPMAG